MYDLWRWALQSDLPRCLSVPKSPPVSAKCRSARTRRSAGTSNAMDPREHSSCSLALVPGSSPHDSKQRQPRSLNCNAALWNEGYADPLAWAGGFRIGFKPLVEAIFSARYPRASKLIARANLDWHGNSNADDAVRAWTEPSDDELLLLLVELHLLPRVTACAWRIRRSLLLGDHAFKLERLTPRLSLGQRCREVQLRAIDQTCPPPRPGRRDGRRVAGQSDRRRQDAAGRTRRRQFDAPGAPRGAVGSGTRGAPARRARRSGRDLGRSPRTLCKGSSPAAGCAPKNPRRLTAARLKYSDRCAVQAGLLNVRTNGRSAPGEGP